VRKLIQSAFYSFLLTLFGMSWYYVIGMVLTLSQNGDLVKFAQDCLVGGVVCFAFLTFVFYELAGSLERLNRPRDENERKDGEPKDPKDGPHS
jgi:hypothetical protein